MMYENESFQLDQKLCFLIERTTQSINEEYYFEIFLCCKTSRYKSIDKSLVPLKDKRTGTFDSFLNIA